MESAARATGGIITANSGTYISPSLWMDVEKSLFRVKESVSQHQAEIAQIQIMLVHHPRGSCTKQTSAAEDHDKANMKQHEYQHA